jgi:molybdate transport system substrate-binding protein
LLLAALCGGGPVHAAEIAVAAAADLNFAFKDLAAEYEKTTGQRVKLSLGSSGNFYSQIQNGAPFDLYFSADVRYPQKLAESGHAIPGTLYMYAVGRIVLWASKGSAVDVQKGLTALLDPTAKKIAIANPRHAPYGRAAVAAMEHFNVYDRVKEKLVLGENVSQAAQFAQSGAADLGIVALSLALTPAMKDAGKYWEIPAEAHPPLKQTAVILKASRNQEAARAFLEFIRAPQGQEIMRRYGFTLPH